MQPVFNDFNSTHSSLKQYNNNYRWSYNNWTNKVKTIILIGLKRKKAVRLIAAGSDKYNFLIY